MIRGHAGLQSLESALGGPPDRTLTDHDRATTIFLRKIAARRWAYVVKLATTNPSGELQIGEVIQAGERTSSRRAESLAMELAEEIQPRVRELLNKRATDRERMAEQSRRYEKAMLERDKLMAQSVAANIKLRLQAIDPNSIVGEWRPGDVMELAPFRSGRGKAIFAHQLGDLTIIASRQKDPEVFAVCRDHNIAYGTYSQGDARELTSRRMRWCTECSASREEKTT
ncbi:hypothetical protein [Nocardia shimofusensis]|uniref:hypothetical protein n=1 Tax=Nocardia shimofusensis TaxID=228596 RepID=UPI000A95BAC7|nr:hypothetical protein [Nocardia shimofusensis]